MELVIVAALALALGFLLGVGVGAVRTARAAAARRAIAGASGALAQLWPDTLPARSPSDILAGRIVITLGGREYVLPVLPRRAAREWLARLDGEFAGMADALSHADTPDILRLLASDTDRLYDVLLSYDAAGVLPQRDSEEDYATEAEILRAVLEVWAALHPLAVALLAGSEDQPTSGTSSEPPRPSPAPTDGGLSTWTGA